MKKISYPPYRRTVPQDWWPKPPTPQSGPNYPIRGFSFSGGPALLDTIRFYNFTANYLRNASAISIGRPSVNAMSASNQVKNIWFDNVNITLPVYLPDLVNDGERSAVILDKDGTLTGYAPEQNSGAVVVNNHPFWNTSSCQPYPHWGAKICPNHFVGLSVTYDTSQLYVDGPRLIEFLKPDDLNTPYILCGGFCEPDFSGNPSTKSGRAEGILMLYRDYYVNFLTRIPKSVRFAILNQPHRMRFTTYNELRLALCYPKGSNVTSIFWNDYPSPIKSATSLKEFKQEILQYNEDGNGMWYYDTDTGLLWVRMIIKPDQVNVPFGEGFGGNVNVTVSVPETYDIPSKCQLDAYQVPDTQNIPPFHGFLQAKPLWDEPQPNVPIPLRDCNDPFCAWCSDGVCKLCYNLFYLQAGVCVACQDQSCASCSSEGCLSCNPGFYLKDRACIEEQTCVLNCDICTASTCNKCSDEWFLNGTSCQRCTDPFCSQCSDGVQCEACMRNYYLSERGLCERCPGGSNCSVCPLGKCEVCYENFLLKDGVCEPCAMSHCKICQPENICLSCNDAHYWDPSLGSCLHCGNGCKTCTNGTKCDACATELSGIRKESVKLARYKIAELVIVLTALPAT